MLFFQCPVLPEIFFRSSDLAMLDGIVGEMKHDDPEEIREAYKYAFRDPGKSSKTGLLSIPSIESACKSIL